MQPQQQRQRSRHSDSDDDLRDDDGTADDVESQRRKGLAEPVSPSFLSRRWLSISVVAMFLLLALAGMRFATRTERTDVTHEAAAVDAEAERRAEDSAIEQATHFHNAAAVTDAEPEAESEPDAVTPAAAQDDASESTSEPKLNPTRVPELPRDRTSLAAEETEHDAELAAEEAAAAASHAAAFALVPLNRLPFDAVAILPETTAEPNRYAAKSPRACESIAQELGQRTRLVLIGDSITQRWVEQPSWASLAAEPYVAANLGVDGDRTEHVLFRLTEGRNLDPLGPQAARAVLLIGTNNLHSSPTASILQGQRKILALMQTQFKHILFIACLPRLDAGAERAAQLAAASKVLADPERGVDWIDLAPEFLTAAGAIDASLFVDTVHLSDSGYRIILRAIQSWVQRTSKEDEDGASDNATETATETTPAAPTPAAPDADSIEAPAAAKDTEPASDAKTDDAPPTSAAAAAEVAAAPAASDATAEKEDAELTPTPLAHPTFAVPATAAEPNAGDAKTASGTAASAASVSSFVVDTDGEADASTPVPAPAQHMAAVDVMPISEGKPPSSKPAAAAADVAVPIVAASPPESFEPAATPAKGGVAPAKIETAATAVAVGGFVSNAELVDSLPAALARIEESAAEEKASASAAAAAAAAPAAVPSGAANSAPSSAAPGSEKMESDEAEVIPPPPPMADPPPPDTADPDVAASSNEVGSPQPVPVEELHLTPERSDADGADHAQGVLTRLPTLAQLTAKDTAEQRRAKDDAAIASDAAEEAGAAATDATPSVPVEPAAVDPFAAPATVAAAAPASSASPPVSAPVTAESKSASTAEEEKQDVAVNNKASASKSTAAVTVKEAEPAANSAVTAPSVANPTTAAPTESDKPAKPATPATVKRAAPADATVTKEKPAAAASAAPATAPAPGAA